MIDKMSVPFAGRVFDEKEILAAIRASIDFWLTAGPETKKFEEALSKVCKTKYALFVNSGSSASLCAFESLKEVYGVSKGDRIATTALGFPTTIAPIIQTGCVPVFIDIEENTANVNVELLANAIKEHDCAGAVLAHTLGVMFDVEGVRSAVTNGRFLLEDACDALGSSQVGKSGKAHIAGSVGDAATLSFYPAHHVTSLPYEEPILLQSPDGKIHSYPIGKFVETVDHTGWRCPAFDKDGDIQWRNITGVVSHPFTDKHLYKITTQTGRNTTITGNHSLFKLDALRNIVLARAEDLSVGEFIVVPKSLPNIEQSVSVEYTNYKRGSWKRYDSAIDISADFANFLGWFVAEGSLYKSKRGNHNITFSLHKKEKPIALQLLHFLKKNFNIVARICKTRENSIILTFSNKAMYNFLLEYCGNGAHKKQIPEFIFRVPSGTKWAFLNAYYAGDGHYHVIKKSISDSFDCKTVSRQLACDLHHLLLMLGVSSRISYYQPRARKIHLDKHMTTPSEVYSVCYNASLNSLVNSEAFKGGDTQLFPRHKKDLSMVRITKIEKVRYTKPHVYDLSVNGYENFISGIGFVVHNTGEGGAVITSQKAIYDRARSFRDWGRDCSCETGQDGKCGQRFDGQWGSLPSGWDHKYVYSRFGYNVKATEIQAAIGNVQITRLEAFGEARRKNRDIIVEALEPLIKKGFLSVQQEYPSTLLSSLSTIVENTSSWFGLMVVLNPSIPREGFIRFLTSRGIQTRMPFAGNIIRQPCFNKLKLGEDYLVPHPLTVTDTYCGCAFFVGVWPGMTDAQRDWLITCFLEYLENETT